MALFVTLAAPAGAGSAADDARSDGADPAGQLYPVLEGMVAAGLTGYLGAADRWEVILAREGNDLSSGRLSHLDAKGVRVRTKDGLVIGEVVLAAENIKIDPTSGGIAGVAEIGSGRFRGRLTEQDIERYLSEHGGKNLRKLRVRFRHDEVRVSGVARAGPFRMRVQVYGAPKFHDQVIEFNTCRVSVAGLHMPRRIERKIERRINPILDLRALGIPGRLTRVAVDGEYLVAEGTLSLEPGTPIALRPAR